VPVHAAGPRLYTKVKFRHLVHKHGSGGSRASNISLNLVPFVDMMTILVCFLLMVFSASNVLQMAQKNLDMAIADSKTLLQGAPIIQISKSDIIVAVGKASEQIMTVDAALRDETPGMKLELLHRRLDDEAKKIAAEVGAEIVPAQSANNGLSKKDMLAACQLAASERPAPGQPICPIGLAILQADRDTDVRVINKVVNTAKLAGFNNLMFAIKNK
jgi:biopolymer transport protein ExbD